MSTERYTSNPANPNPAPLELLYISPSKFENDWHSTLHSHQCSEIFYVVSGQCEFHVEGAVFPVRADQVVIINAGVVHTEAVIPGSPIEYIVMGVQGGDFLLEYSDDSRYCTIDCEGTDEILRHIRMILEEMERKELYYGLVAKNLLEILSVRLQRLRSVVLERASESKSSMQCAFLKRYIDNHYKENITLDTLSKITYLNKYYLVHIFTQEYNISPISYLVQRRLAESRYLLAQTDYHISEIALILGFSSSSYFSQCFRRSERLSPREYRQRAKERREVAET